MKTTKILSLFALGVFLVSTASALMVVDGMWADQSQTLEIEKGESASFDVYFVTYDYPMDIFVGMYNSNGQLVHTFIDDETEDNFFEHTYEIRENIYENLGEYQIVIYGLDDTEDDDAVSLFLNVVEENGDDGNGDGTDTTAPEITIISPEEDKEYSKREIKFKVLTNEDADVWFSVDGKANITMENLEDHIFTYTIKLSDGNHEVVFYATDEAGNLRIKDVEFSIDTNDEDDNDRKSSISGGIVDDELDRERYLTQFESKTINVGEESEATTKGVSNWFIWLIVGLIVLIVLIIVVVMMR